MTLGATPAVAVHRLTRRFGDLTAVDDVSLEVGPGEIVGLLGPNGAGKTTTISVLTTLLPPTAGAVRVAGHDVAADPDLVRRAIGVVFQEPTLDTRLTARENLDLHGVLYGLDRGYRRRRTSEVLRMVDLEPRADDLVEGLSGGMRRRLEIVRGLLHEPLVLFLDEPTVGLDPQTRRSIWQHVLALRGELGVTVLMTTHYMDEAEWCDRIVVIDHGRIVASDQPGVLKRSVGRHGVELLAADPAELVEFLTGEGFSADRVDEHVRVEVDASDRFVPWLLRTYTGDVETVTCREPTLDDFFLRLTGRRIRDAEIGADELARHRFREAMAMRSRR